MRPTRVIGVSLVALLILAAPAAASAAVRIAKIQYDPPGSDTGTNSHLNMEYVVLKNTGNRP